MRVGLYTPHAMVEPPVADDEDDLDDPDDAVQIVLQPEGDVYEEEEEEEEAPLEGEDVVDGPGKGDCKPPSPPCMCSPPTSPPCRRLVRSPYRSSCALSIPQQRIRV